MTDETKRYNVRVEVKGVVYIVVEGDPNDADGWTDALDEALADIPNDELFEAVDGDSAEVIGEVVQ
jgi:hypothetical protein